MNNLTAQEIIDYYIEIGPILEKATYEGEYKNANKYTKTKIEKFKMLEQDIDLSKRVLSVLIYEKNIETRITAAAYCLALNVFVKEAIQILKSIQKDPTAKIYSLNAEMTLKEWEKGNLTIYQKKNKK